MGRRVREDWIGRGPRSAKMARAIGREAGGTRPNGAEAARHSSAVLGRRQLADSLLRQSDPRLAAFAFGLRGTNLPRRGAACRADPDPNPELAALLEEAAPVDCLEAAFALSALPPEGVARVASGQPPVAPPFLDRDYHAAIARWLGCRFDEGGAVGRALAIPGAEVTRSATGAAVRVRRGSEGIYLFAPDPFRLPAMAALLARTPAAARSIVIVPPHAIPAARGTSEVVRVEGRLDPLHAIAPCALANRVTTPAQAAVLASVGVAALAWGIAAPLTALWTGVAVVTAVLLGYAASRALPIWSAPHGPLRRHPLGAAELPVYSILVPLYREGGEQLAELVRALRRFDYPPDRLDIQFLVEADDPETHRAVEVFARELPCRMTVVPAGAPRTKPRALNVGFRQARGQLVTIFDAEDRPDPAQLRIAAETFAAAPRELAALQARLSIDHGGDNWLTRMFAVEYACQFDHILPMVASRGGLVLLGGTSNHFRAEAIARVGGWDPFNVTEDADLSVRLRRFGYRIGTIDSETHEEAPTTVRAWLKQRSRWFKGYMQTWLVHHRRPLALLREIGWRDTLLFNLFVVGALTAALAHVAFMAELALALTGAPVLFGGAPLVSAVQIMAFVAGYGASFALAAVSIRRRRDPRLRLGLLATFPVYWLLMGAAVLIAAHDLLRRPHHWHKTEHGVAVRPRRLAFRWAGTGVARRTGRSVAGEP